MLYHPFLFGEIPTQSQATSKEFLAPLLGRKWSLLRANLRRRGDTIIIYKVPNHKSHLLAITLFVQNKKDVDNDIVKLKLFPFSLRDRVKIWFSSLPRNSIDSWNKCKDAFITKYFPLVKIISHRTQIMNLSNLSMNMLHNLGKE